MKLARLGIECLNSSVERTGTKASRGWRQRKRTQPEKREGGEEERAIEKEMAIDNERWVRERVYTVV